VSKTFFITGASRGLGRELCEQALSRGDRVAATARQPSQLDDLAAEHGDRLWVAALDVTDTAAVREVVGRAFTEFGRIDVVVSNAGYGVAGAAEELTDAQVESMLATNLTASIHLARAVTPHLREQGGGHLIQMSSMGGFIAFPASPCTTQPNGGSRSSSRPGPARSSRSASPPLWSSPAWCAPPSTTPSRSSRPPIPTASTRPSCEAMST
jgi:NAD(P)-dependent dehydrogenase (short-subunit alcohol dehydrogenase family)